jgi:hypothetical protein
MFSALTLKVNPQHSPLDNLRDAVTVLARFGRDRRALVLRIAADAMAGETLAADFLRANLPRHVNVIGGLLVQAQQAGLLVPLPPPSAIAFLFGAVGAPILIGAAMQQHADATTAESIDGMVLSDAAIAQRVDLALRGLSAPSVGRSR